MFYNCTNYLQLGLSNRVTVGELELVPYTLCVLSCPTKFTGLYRTVSTFVPCSIWFTRLIWTKMARSCTICFSRIKGICTVRQLICMNIWSLSYSKDKFLCVVPDGQRKLKFSTKCWINHHAKLNVFQQIKFKQFHTCVYVCLDIISLELWAFSL